MFRTLFWPLYCTLFLLTAAPCLGKSRLELTAAEQAYLQSRPHLNVVFDRDYPPFEFLENGQIQGFTHGLLQLLEQRLGVPLRADAPPTWTEALHRMQRGEADIVTSIVRTPDREAYLLFTEPYISVPLGVITRADMPWTGIESLWGRTVALVRNYAGTHHLREQLKNHAQFIEADTVAETLLLVALGQADAVVHNTVVAAHLLVRLGLTNLQVREFLNATLDLSLALRRDDPILAGILQKALASITPKEWEGLRRTWLPTHPPMAPATRRALMVAGAIALGCLVALGGLALFLTRRLRLRLAELRRLHADQTVLLTRLRLALEATRAGIWEHDPTTGQETHSPGWYQMLGMTPPPNDGNGYTLWRSLVHPEDLAQAEAAFQHFLHDPKANRFTARFRMRTAHGTWHWIQSYGMAAERDAHGLPTKIVGLHLDIHDLEEARTQLQASQARLQAVLQHVPVGYALLRREGRELFIEDANPFAGPIFGIAPQAEIGRSLHAVLPWIADTPFPRFVHEAIDLGLPRIHEAYSLQDHTGIQRFFHFIIFPTAPDTAGVFFRDVTEQRRSQQVTEDALTLFRMVFHLSPEGLALVDPEGTILHANAEFVRLTSPSGAEPPTLDSVAVFSPQLLQSLRALMAENQTLRQQWDAKAPRGGRLPLSLTARCIILHDQPHLLLALRDLTESQRIQELLVQTEKMLSLGGIAAGIAHEINNPLGIILQSAQNAELRLRPDFAKNRQVAEELGLHMETMQRYLAARGILDFLADIREAGSRAATIVRTMIDFGRQSSSHRASCSVQDIVENAISLASKDYDLKKHYDFKRIFIERDFTLDLPPVFVSASEIEQILLNLLRNAAQALHAAPPADGPRILVQTRRMGNMVRISVADNGPGIPEDILPHIFEPFFTTKPPGQGTGLGLSVSFFIAQNHGGRLWAESQPGSGAVFHLELPGEEGSATALPPSEPRDESHARTDD